jgi:hypothetical protein
MVVTGLVEPEEQVVLLPSEIHVLDDVQVVAEREILVDDLDSELGRILRAVDRRRLAVEDDLPGVVAVDAGDALDQRRLPGAVVADERHHLAVADLEVDVRQRLHGSVGLGYPTELEERCLAHSGGLLPTTFKRLEAPRRRLQLSFSI